MNKQFRGRLEALPYILKGESSLRISTVGTMEEERPDLAMGENVALKTTTEYWVVVGGQYSEIYCHAY